MIFIFRENQNEINLNQNIFYSKLMNCELIRKQFKLTALQLRMSRQQRPKH